ncbi:hypothetical protein AYI68_g519 [Smittium mucronatum]|uniref:Uncharacterized protein n=1 Tax=Smittium mucronatum TaxID=133383 RepID=A0A1R0H7Y3_9FUNG|nr:hypothetical protein AYI68_g519 [Smittium mucronatum]
MKYLKNLTKEAEFNSTVAQQNGTGGINITTPRFQGDLKMFEPSLFKGKLEQDTNSWLKIFWNFMKRK